MPKKMSTWPNIRTKPVTDEYEKGHVSTFGRVCRQCKGSMKDEPMDAIWCQRCKDFDLYKYCKQFDCDKKPVYVGFCEEHSKKFAGYDFDCEER